MNVLICNAGSSSIKLSLIEAKFERRLVEAEIDWGAEGSLRIRPRQQREIRRRITSTNHGQAIVEALSELQIVMNLPSRDFSEVAAVGHRVVHGGARFTKAVRITNEVRQEIDALTEIAPLHNAASIEVIDAVSELLPRVPQVAAFDTSFHSTLSEAARTYPVPYQWTSEWGLRRYGFHGLNHSYCAARAAEILRQKNQRLVIAHLGNGASLSAVHDGVCVDTSMGFTPLDGVMMGTRSGSIDPGIVIYLMRHRGMNADQIDRALNHESGLLGVSGVSSDMRDVLTAAAAGNRRAGLAIEVYVHRLTLTIGAMAAVLGGVDALVFSGGVGEHAQLIRERVCENLGHLELELDRSRNADCEADTDIATPPSRGRILVIAAREDLSIVREVMSVIQPRAKEGERL